jgi:TRAP transporter TAXI family solute receptor
MKLKNTSTVIRSLISLVLGLATAFAAVQALANEGDDFHDKLMQLGAGPEGGSFGPIGNTLCEALNAERKTTLVRCIPVATAGSVFNIHAVANGSLQLGLGQEDLLGQGYGNGSVKGGTQLRTVALMHNSPIGIMVRKASGITELSQIRRGVVNIGNKGAGYHANAMAVMKAMNLRESDFVGVTYMPPTAFIQAFCDGKVDVIFNALAHPSGQYRQLRACGGEFLSIPPDVMKKMMLDNVWLRPMSIAAGMYDPVQQEVKTLGMRNLLFTHAKVDEEAIFRVTSLLASRYAALQASQTNLSSMLLLKQSDLGQLAVPLHPGALRALQRREP